MVYRRYVIIKGAIYAMCNSTATADGRQMQQKQLSQAYNKL
jgi:hypothetical protein